MSVPRSPRGPGSSRRPRTEAPPAASISRSTGPSATNAQGAAAAGSPASGPETPAVLRESEVVEPGDPAGQPAGATRHEALRFQIFIIDAGWNSPARKVLHENFALLRDLQKGAPIYVLSREKSIEFALSHPSVMGKSPVLAVHDLEALEEGGTTGFHGFRLHLGLMRT